MDWYIGTFPPLFVALFEVLIVTYVYGKSLSEQTNEVLNQKSPNVETLKNIMLDTC